MTRFRALAAILACLAVLAGGVVTVAALAAPFGMAATERSAANPPCSGCDDCNDRPCPMPSPCPAASCLHIAASVAPILVASGIDLPSIDAAVILWPRVAATLAGFSQPPDPFPPRA